VRVEVAVSGHFGELLQGLLGPDGPVALVTLPAPPLEVMARWRRGPFGLQGAAGALLGRGRVAALWRAVAGGPPRGRLRLAADMPPGGGAGSSTAALLAAAGAFAAAAGRALPDPEALAALCLRLEGASDPLMHPDPGALLWAPRQARVLAPLPPLPALDVVGGFLGPGRRTDPADRRFADISDLAAAWGPAAARGDLPALGALATESARRDAAVRGGPGIAAVEAVGARHGALGVVAAHTGAARGLIFAPGAGDPAAAARELAELGLAGVLRYRLG
jgi:uncharacterized protein involved in propanediol utilization